MFINAQKIKFSIKDFSSKCEQIRRKLLETADLVTFTGEIVNGKLHFFVQFILFCTAKWNCYNLLGASLKIKRFPLKEYLIKTIFSSDISNFLIEVR